MGLHKILKWLALGLAIIAVVFSLMVASGNNDMIDFLIYIAYAVLVIIIALVLIYTLKGLFSGNVKKTMISLALFLGIFIVAYVVSGGDTTVYNYNGQPATDTESHLTGTGITAFFIFGILAVLSMVYAAVSRLNK
ncbi:MAG: hypothetical protein ACWA5P_01000 [bacterium]